MNTYTPTGSQTFTNQGNDPNTGAPVYSSQVTLSPEQQALYNSNTSNQLNQSGFAGNALDTARDAYQPLNTDYGQQRQEAQDALYQRNTQYLDPQYKQSGEALDAKLAAQGITPGSEAYNNAHQQYDASKDQAYEAARNDAVSGATGQAGQNIQQSIALQNQPLNYYNSLMTGSQASMPSFGQPANVSSNPADVQGAFQNAYTGQVNTYNAQTGQQNQNTAAIGSILAMLLL